jgi:hypothetical protein
LSENDLKQIGELMDVKFVSFDKKMDEKLDKRFGDSDLKMDERFVKFEDRIVDRLVGEIGEVIEQNINPQFETIRTRLDKVETTMVTKDYLDEKLGTVNGKIAILTGVLQRNGTISEDQRRAVHA